VKFMGEQKNPGDSTSFVIPQVGSPVGGFAVNSIGDYFGLPTVGQVGAGNQVIVNALPFRAYNLIWNEWFRDENLQNSLVVDTDDGRIRWVTMRSGAVASGMIILRPRCLGLRRALLLLCRWARLLRW